MSDKGIKALQTADKNRISTLVWKLIIAIEDAIKRDIPFTEVDSISKLAAESFKFFLEHGVRYNNLLFLNYNTIIFIFFPTLMATC
jgi:thiosulfate reductase cytochrome b subunit